MTDTHPLSSIPTGAFLDIWRTGEQSERENAHRAASVLCVAETTLTLPGVKPATKPDGMRLLNRTPWWSGPIPLRVSLGSGGIVSQGALPSIGE